MKYMGASADVTWPNSVHKFESATIGTRRFSDSSRLAQYLPQTDHEAFVKRVLRMAKESALKPLPDAFEEAVRLSFDGAWMKKVQDQEPSLSIQDVSDRAMEIVRRRLPELFRSGVA